MVDFTSLKRIFDKLDPPDQRGGQPGGPQAGSKFSQGIGNLGPSRSDADDDKATRLSFFIRIAQIILAFCLLISSVVLAIFQGKWVGGLSGLTGFLIFLSVAALISSAMFLVAPILYERSNYKYGKSLNRALGEARVGLVVNGVWTMIGLIGALAITISAYTSAGCKDASKDPHADKPASGTKEDFQKALPSFCTTKKAASAFAWFVFVSWLLTLLLFLRSWRSSRKNGPRIPPFVHPAENSAFEPLGDEEDDPYGGGGGPISSRYGDGGDGRYGGGYDDDDGAYRAPGAYGDSSAYGRSDSPARHPTRTLADIEARYGMKPPGPPQHQDSYSYSSYDQHRAPNPYNANPFNDGNAVGRQSYDYGAYSQGGGGGVGDPYAAIQSQLNSNARNGPPRLPELGYSGAYR